jgi:probable F420-dependent oxidoreductase
MVEDARPMEMRFGAIFPQTEVGAADAGALREYAQAVQDLGYVDLIAYDHVLGASASFYRDADLLGPYREADSFREPFVLFGFLAGVAPGLSFATNVLVLPQRQTVLVAKQAAEVDVLCGGRLRLGIGIGWNSVEYQALGVPFRERAARQEEQIRLLRELWTRPLVRFEGGFHRVIEAGLNPLPIQRPIPIWLGGMAEGVLERVGRLADGWFPVFPGFGPARTGALPQTTEPPASMIERVHRYAREAGRDPSKIGIGGRIAYASQTPEDWHRQLGEYRKLGATEVALNTMGAGLRTIDEHIAALRHFAEAIGLGRRQ